MGENYTCKEERPVGMYDIYFIIQLIYGIPSLFMWARIIKAILIDRSHVSFTHPFHRVLAATGIISIIVFINDMVFTRFLLMGRFCQHISKAFSTPTYWLSPTVFIAMYGIGCQLTGSVLLSINRLTAVLTIRHKEIWSRHLFTAYVFLFTPSLITSWYLIPALSIITVEKEGSMSITYMKLFDWISTTLFSSVMAAFAGVIILVCTALTLLCFRRMRKMKINANRTERIVFVTGMFQAGSTMLMCVYQLVMYLLILAGLKLQLSYLFTLRSFFWDILTLLPAWATFFSNENIRSTFRKTEIKKKSISTAWTSVGRSK